MHPPARNGHFSLIRIVGSLWFAGVILVMLLVAMACATVYESIHGTERALATCYRSWWFESLLALLALNVFAAMVVRFPFSRRQIGFVVTHSAILVTLAGALVTKHFGVEGRIGIAEGQTVRAFTSPIESLVISTRNDQTRASLDLDSPEFQTFEAVELENPPSVTLGDVGCEIVRYLPDSAWVEKVVDDNPQERPAIRVSLLSNGEEQEGWIYAGGRKQLGSYKLSYRTVADESELAKLLNRKAPIDTASVGRVKVDHEGAVFQLAVEECMKTPMPLGDTGYTVRVVRYLPHAVVGAKGAISSASDEPINPFIEVEIAGNDARETHKAFAKFPDFSSIHGRKGAEGVKVTFLPGAAARPSAPIELFGRPDGEFHVRFNPTGKAPTDSTLAIGQTIETPWPQLKLTLHQQFDRARAVWTLDPIEPARTDRTPGLQVRLRRGNETRSEWLQIERPRTVVLGRTPYQLRYTDKKIPLDFAIKLEDFRVGYYPGGRRPRSFESTITLTDDATKQSYSRLISMNHPVKFNGYSLFQSSYEMNGGRTVSYLTISKDPGLPIVFAGYIAMMIGMMTVIATRIGEHRKKTAGPHHNDHTSNRHSHPQHGNRHAPSAAGPNGREVAGHGLPADEFVGAGATEKGF